MKIVLLICLFMFCEHSLCIAKKVKLKDSEHVFSHICEVSWSDISFDRGSSNNFVNFSFFMAKCARFSLVTKMFYTRRYFLISCKRAF